MESEEIKKRINVIINSSKFGLEVFSVLSVNESFCLKKFQVDDSLNSKIKEIICESLNKEILNDEFFLKKIDEIDSKSSCYYEIPQNSEYNPFAFILETNDALQRYNEKEQNYLKGFLLKLNINENFFYIYQHKYATTLINRSSSLFARLNGDVYTPLDCDVVKIDSRIDVIIIDNYLITKNINLLQTRFGFETYIRNKATETIDVVDEKDIVSDIKILKKLALKPKLTIAKKLLKANSSLVLSIPKDELLKRLKEHDIYSKLLKFTKDNKILLSSEKNVKEFLKMLNDEILYSTLTKNNYESPLKDLFKGI